MYWDHPRIRGEHILGRLRVPERLGSSPHTRGAPACSDIDYFDLGIIPAYAGSTIDTGDSVRVIAWIIPAYAGSTSRCLGVLIILRDHPRIRGEHGGG